jgi:hypothetical protein
MPAVSTPAAPQQAGVFSLEEDQCQGAHRDRGQSSCPPPDAEYVAASEASKEAIWMRGVVNDLQIPGMHYDAIPLYIDNDAARKLSRNPGFHNRTKDIDIRYHVLRERVMGV